MAVVDIIAPAATAGTDTDSSPSLFGYAGPVNGVHRAMPFEPMPSGVSSATGAALATVCSADLPFKVVARDAAGTETTVQTGLLLAGHLQADAAGLSLSPLDFLSTSTMTYAVRLDFPEVPSGTVPGGFELLGAPADGSGFIVTVSTARV
jgi:hypothetical protein